MSGTFECGGCDTEDQGEEHHIIPRTYGGSTGPTVFLCATCHSRVHKIALALMKNKTPDGIPAGILERLMKYAKAIVRAKSIREDYPEHFQDQELHILQIRLTPVQLQRLHKLKADRGFSSLDKLMSSVIAKLTRTEAK